MQNNQLPTASHDQLEDTSASKTGVPSTNLWFIVIHGGVEIWDVQKWHELSQNELLINAHILHIHRTLGLK